MGVFLGPLKGNLSLASRLNNYTTENGNYTEKGHRDPPHLWGGSIDFTNTQ